MNRRYYLTHGYNMIQIILNWSIEREDQTLACFMLFDILAVKEDESGPPVTTRNQLEVSQGAVDPPESSCWFK